MLRLPGCQAQTCHLSACVSFFGPVDLHPEVGKISVSEDVVGTKAVRQRCASIDTVTLRLLR